LPTAEDTDPHFSIAVCDLIALILSLVISFSRLAIPSVALFVSAVTLNKSSFRKDPDPSI
jgi:hypothetical protein